MMTPTRKSGRQPKPSARLKEFLYENDMEKTKESPSRSSVEKKPVKAAKDSPPRPTEKKLAKTAKEPPPRAKQPIQIKKEPVSKVADRKNLPASKQAASRMVEQKKVSPVKKAPEPRIVPKKSVPVVKKEIPDTAPARKSRRVPKPSVKLEEFIYEDDREKSVENSSVSSRESEKPKKTIKKEKEEFLSDMDEDEDEEEDEDEDEESSSDSQFPVTKKSKDSAYSKARVTNTAPRGRPPLLKGGITSPRARISNMTSLAAKKQKAASLLTVREGKIYKTSPVSSVKRKEVESLKQRKMVTKPSGASLRMVSSSSMNKRKRELESEPDNKKFIKTKHPAKLISRIKNSSEAKITKNSIEAKNNKNSSQGKINKTSSESRIKISSEAKENKKGRKIVEKREVEKVLQVNKEVMTQLLNFGAEVAEAMASNNESIFSFSTKDNPLETFKIDKQDDFSDEEVVKIIKWFEEEEEQRRAYRKRILEALRASHETNMSLYTQMLKMLQSVTAC